MIGTVVGNTQIRTVMIVLHATAHTLSIHALAGCMGGRLALATAKPATIVAADLPRAAGSVGV